MASEENVVSWKNADFVEFCKNNSKYSVLAEFMRSPFLL